MTATIVSQQKKRTVTFSTPSKEASPDQAKSLIYRVIEQAETNHGFICITGYRSDTGRVCNYVLQPYGPDAYHRLVEESLRLLESGKIYFPNLPENLWNQEITETDWACAILEQIFSFRQTLEGGHKREDNREKINKGFYELNGSVYVANVRIVSCHETSEQAEENAKIKDKIADKDIPKSALAKAKKHIRGLTPVGNYRGQFRLDADKFDRIAFAGTVIEFAEYGQLFGPEL
jgi:hypothetical protein